MKRLGPTLLAFEDGRRGPQAKECGQRGMWPSQKGLGIDFPPEPPEGNTALCHLAFSPVRPIPNFRPPELKDNKCVFS